MLDVRALSDTRYHFIDLSCPYVNEIRAVWSITAIAVSVANDSFGHLWMQIAKA
ncbi:hypothetical protein WN51_09825 [Melipona quadrifasciata]|uniref:Uncharacterized protein n=1 Tax=Melipona quadrifasciata TaxID=166423 RepID=A0A0N0U6C1_9HYME|nr:hypothetical protein WN51_09825 [Melipona quadrifasciata]